MNFPLAPNWMSSTSSCINAAESIAAAKWFNGLELAVCSLTRMPGRCPLAPESKRARVALYHLLYGNKPDVYRAIYAIAIYAIAIYTINETACVVNVLTVRHGAMDLATPAEVESCCGGKP